MVDMVGMWCVKVGGSMVKLKLLNISGRGNMAGVRSSGCHVRSAQTFVLHFESQQVTCSLSTIGDIGSKIH